MRGLARAKVSWSTKKPVNEENICGRRHEVCEKDLRIRRVQEWANREEGMKSGGARFWNTVLYTSAALAAAGCYGGDALPRQAVSGSVTMDGQPVAHGVISFYPAQRFIEGNMVVGGAHIENGLFSIPAFAGLIPGKYRVAVYAANAIGARRRVDREPGNDRDVPEEIIPRRYNSETILRVEITEHAISSMKIELTSK
jgi:hypothetical protein